MAQGAIDVNRRRLAAFIALLAGLVAVPLGIAAWHEYRLSSGDRVVLRVQPVDPEDLFRGQYVVLSYDISRLDTGAAEPGTTVYVPLHREGAVWTGSQALKVKPQAGRFIRGRVGGPGIRYGIETFYVEEGEGPKYEQAMARQSLYAHVVVDNDGGAELDELTFQPD
jgi:uncharacterized membrane-anchored protein